MLLQVAEQLGLEYRAQCGLAGVHHYFVVAGTFTKSQATGSQGPFFHLGDVSKQHVFEGNMANH